jgi:hypothetical protein
MNKNIILFFSCKKYSFTHVIWILFCGFMVALWISEIWSVATRPEEYAFLWGSEVWYYASESVYLFHLLVLIIWFSAGILLSLLRGPLRWKLLITHVILSMLWLMLAYNDWM